MCLLNTYGPNERDGIQPLSVVDASLRWLIRIFLLLSLSLSLCGCSSTVLRQATLAETSSPSSSPSLTFGEVEELSEAEMVALGLEVDREVEEDEEDLEDEEWDEEEGLLESGEGAGGLESRTFFKLRPPTVMPSESEVGQLGWAGTKPLKQAQVRDSLRLGGEEEEEGEGLEGGTVGEVMYVPGLSVNM